MTTKRANRRLFACKPSEYASVRPFDSTDRVEQQSSSAGLGPLVWQPRDTHSGQLAHRLDVSRVRNFDEHMPPGIGGQFLEQT